MSVQSMHPHEQTKNADKLTFLANLHKYTQQTNYETVEILVCVFCGLKWFIRVTLMNATMNFKIINELQAHLI